VLHSGGWTTFNLQVHGVPKIMACACFLACLRRIGLAFAFTSYLDLSLLFFPVSHMSFLQHLLGSSWPSLIRYHR
jgi:hypothetical protein